MAEYKVPQDVEADDKLIGPFSFRQFIYLIIVALAGGAAWGLGQIFIGLAIIPLPIILLFGALALPLRKDQPMEIYLAALIAFYLKPHRRLWDPDGVDSIIEVTAPKTIDPIATKNLTAADAEQRFSYLAELVDSQGWAIRGAQPSAALAGTMGTPMNNDLFLEAQGAQDVLDASNSIGQSFDAMMSERTQKLKEEARQHMMMSPMTTTAAGAVADGPAPVFNPYPTDIHQTMVQPVNDDAHVYHAPDEPSTKGGVNETTSTPPPPEVNAPSETVVSADIMNLANNSDLSIETLSKEAHRLEEKQHSLDEEVVISLR